MESSSSVVVETGGGAAAEGHAKKKNKCEYNFHVTVTFIIHIAEGVVVDKEETLLVLRASPPTLSALVAEVRKHLIFNNNDEATKKKKGGGWEIAVFDGDERRLSAVSYHQAARADTPALFVQCRRASFMKKNNNKG